MEVRKTPLIVSALVVAGSAATAMADFQGISFTSSSTDNGVVYQIYVDVLAGDQLNAVYGDADNALSVDGTGAFYQNAFGNHSVSGMNPALFGVFPSLLNDSYVTIGLETNVGNAMLDIGIDWTSFNAGGSIWTDNGSWFATPDDAQVYEIGGKVMIMQLTMDEGESFSLEMNLQGKNADGSNWTALAVTFPAPPAPGALALLGIAGIAVRRRRH
jgi:MYXO-CTERM domain-containing protein